MAPKKNKGAKKGKGDDDEIDQGQMNTILKAEVDCLKQKLVLEQERMDRSAATEEAIRQDQLDLDKEMEEHRDATRIAVREMTVMYRKMESDQQSQITAKETNVAEQEEKKKNLNEDIARLKKEREEQEAAKDQEIAELKDKINEMSTDFAQMLKDTLQKMQERIDLANQWEGDAMTESGPATGIVQRGAYNE